MTTAYEGVKVKWVQVLLNKETNRTYQYTPLGLSLEMVAFDLKPIF